ncbi:thiol reductant ABC exporter subunit CydC [Geomicrobium sp. JCM 19038]|uniref:thiol reductant ABC exporter subunit CydC n=1 Tax=Geomicrobium sp. JCM 19038 TaxID=1460635 RepID=UPI00045F1E87|nr:thiol reductant ABC exporter subunit CydC [Geomicrobium sp. JCM 19038]GAK09198.1 transport ATP-binding protein CydC [Geomicrobium sp. JCM 19038]
MKALTPFIKLIIAEKRDLFLSILAGFIAGITAVGLFSASGYLISHAALTPPIATLMVIVAIVKLLGITSAVSRFGERYYSHRATFTMLSNIRLRVYEKLEPVSNRILNRYTSGDILSRIVGDVDALQNVLLRVVYPPIVMLSVFLATIAFTTLFSIGTAVLIILGLALSLLVIPALFFLSQRRVNDEIRETRGELSSTFAEYVYGFRELTIHQAREEREQKVRNTIKQYEQQKQKSQSVQMWSDATIGLLSFLVSVAVLFYAGYQVAEGNLAGILLALLLMITLTVFEQITPMATLPYHLQESTHAAKRIESLEEENQPEVSSNDIQLSKALDIEFQDVMLQFEDQLRPAIQRVNAQIPSGSKTAIIGASGSGKTTIANVLLKALPYDQGTVKVDGHELSTISEDTLWKNTNVSLQSNHFFVGTVRDNLFVTEEMTDDITLKNALHAAELPHLELDSRVEEKGQNLSGGEKQRLAIARLLLREAPLWVLDEPTTSLDALTEERMLRLLLERAKDATVVLISHRLTGLDQMDQIIVVDHGQIIESGTYDELMQKDGYFKKMKALEEQLFMNE